MSIIDGHTCIGDDGGTALRRCEKCEAGQPERQSNGCVDRDLIWRLRDALVETAKPHLPDGLSVDEAWRAVRRVLGI